VTVAELGEMGLIARVTARLRALPPPAGPGDDAAVVPAPDGRVVATTDVLVDGVHFRLAPGWSSAADVGWKAAAQNLADIAAMGAVPTALLVGLVTPPGLTVDDADGLADGLRDACASTGATVVGGDVVAGAQLVLAVTALGDLQGRAPVTRAGARPGDAVVIVGALGRSAAGLALLRAGVTTADGYAGRCLVAHRRPDPPYPAGPALADLGATAMLDISDGAVHDARRIASASGVQLRLTHLVDEADWAGLSEVATLTGSDAHNWVLAGGEEHALLATLPPSALDAARALGARHVGEVVAGDGVVRARDGSPYAVTGYDHLAPTRTDIRPAHP